MGSKKELQAAIAVLGLCMLVFGCTKTAESENSKKQVKIGVAVYLSLIHISEPTRH